MSDWTYLYIVSADGSALVAGTRAVVSSLRDHVSGPLGFVVVVLITALSSEIVEVSLSLSLLLASDSSGLRFVSGSASSATSGLLVATVLLDDVIETHLLWV